MRIYPAVLLLCLAVGAAQAADAPAQPAASLLGKRDTDAPINIAADKFVADENAKTGTWSNNVIITQGDIRMRANTVRMNVVGKDNKPDKIFAQGNVVVDSPTSGTVTGDSGVYDLVQKTVTLSGHVVLTKQKNSMRGAQMTVNLVTGIATLGGGAAAPGAPGQPGRVQGVFMPANRPSGGN